MNCQADMVKYMSTCNKYRVTQYSVNLQYGCTLLRIDVCILLHEKKHYSFELHFK